MRPLFSIFICKTSSTIILNSCTGINLYLCIPYCEYPPPPLPPYPNPSWAPSHCNLSSPHFICLIDSPLLLLLLNGIAWLAHSIKNIIIVLLVLRVFVPCVVHYIIHINTRIHSYTFT